MEKWRKYLKGNKHSRHHQHYKEDRCDVKIVIVVLKDSDIKSILENKKE
jgi:hypothetical protein